MKIDIDRLTEAELIDLNHRIVARLRFLNQMRAQADDVAADRTFPVPVPPSEPRQPRPGNASLTAEHTPGPIGKCIPALVGPCV